MTQSFPPLLTPLILAPRPVWADFALRVIERLVEHHGDRKPAGATLDSGWLSDDLPMLEATLCAVPDAAQQFDDEYLTSLGAELEPTADVAPPQTVRLPLRELCAAMQLAATFQTEASYMDCLARGAVMVLEGFASEELEPIAAVMVNGLTPLDWRLSSVMPGRDDLQVAVLVRPDLYEGEVTQHGKKVFCRKLDEALESKAGMIVLCPAGSNLPAAWRAGLPAPLQLAKLSKDVLIAQLRHSHPFNNLDEPAIRAALPSDRVLATLQYPALRLAHREGSALAAAIRLSELTLPGPNEGLRLRDLVGLGPAKDIALGVVEDLAAWARGDLPWEHVTRGLLLSGAPGSGKTELARCMARETGLTLVSGSYSLWQKEGHLGDFLKAMNNSFATAIAGAPSVLFLDELDAFGSRSQSEGTHNSSYASKCIAGLLELLDGVAGREGVVVIAATNHPEHIDPAIIRSGRFDKHVRISLPSRDDLAVILRQHLGTDLPHAALDRLAALAIGRSGADIAAAVRSARGRARQNRREFEEDDLAAEFCPTSSVKTPEQDRRASVHEAGHAVVIAALGIGTPICLRLNSLGGECITQMTSAAMTAADFHRERMADLGGRAAERFVLGEISSGAGGPEGSDLSKVARSVLREEMSFGLGGFGSLWLSQDPQPLDILRLPPLVQHRLTQRIADAEGDSQQVLLMNRIVLEDLANALNKTRLVEGPVLQAFLSQVICWRGDTPTQSKIDTNITKGSDMTESVDPRLRENIFAAETVLPLEG